MTKNILSTASWLALCTTVLSGSALAASTTNGGTTPNGKPFVNIAGEIIEVQGQILTLEEKVDQVLEGLTTTEDAIEAIYAKIDALEIENDMLRQDMVAADEAQDDALASAIQSNDELIAGLTKRVTDLEDQIEMTHTLSGDCPAGMALVSVDSSPSGGSITCSPIESTPGISQKWVYKPKGYSSADPIVWADCEPGYILTGGSGQAPTPPLGGLPKAIVTGSGFQAGGALAAAHPQGWYTWVVDTTTTPGRQYSATAICIKLE